MILYDCNIIKSIYQEKGLYMRKYIYGISVVYSFFTFMVGWNDFQELGYFRIFNLGLMAVAVLPALFLGYDWAVQMDKKEMEEWNKLCLDDDEVL